MNEDLPKKDAEIKCNARKKNSPGYCSQPSGHRTDHPGAGRCWVHGGRGSTPRGEELYQKVLSDKVGDVKQIFEEIDELDTTEIERLDCAIKLLHATILSNFNSGTITPSTLQGYTNSLERLVRTKIEIEKGLKARIPTEDRNEIIRLVMGAVNRVLTNTPDLKAKLAAELESLLLNEEKVENNG